MSKKKLSVRYRAFRIWQKLGFMPWSKPKAKSQKGDFYKGAFDSIPFLNNDAKRTFVHLLLRPGYMMRDYIKGQHERYLAPLTSLIIFYAFFALISSIVNPDYSSFHPANKSTAEITERPVKVESGSLDELNDSLDMTYKYQIAINNIQRVTDAFSLLSLDKHPEKIDSPVKASLATLENALRSQGIYLFLGQFLLLWVAMCFALKKKGMSASACAATAAYVLCQFCFFMFFSLFLATKEKGEIGVGLMAILLTIDYNQMFGIGWKKGFWLTVKTGLFYLLSFLLLISLLLGIACVYVFANSGMS
ncbi:MAG: DUF3667 domain-containing protein [Bacteroidaceae bacterium]|nr:DUF3667 domain-containing protein [Bacteroidaceae bacterium]